MSRQFNRRTQLFRAARYVLVVVALLAGGLIYYYTFYNSTPVEQDTVVSATSLDSSAVKNGIHVASGLKADTGLDVVLMNCTNCHSAKLISQNRATREGWKNMITWMQETQNLWNLGENEKVILDYLSTNYAPEFKGRRQHLDSIKWYELE
jgi:hypothetical protein